MMKAAKKSPAAKKSTKSTTRNQALTASVVGEVQDGKIDKQPQVKEQAAVARAMFLYTDDAWAQRYFDENDLHFLEREVFG